MLRFRSPAHEDFHIEVSSLSDAARGQKYFEQLTVTDLKYKISQTGYCSCSPERIRIILHGNELSDSLSIRDVLDLIRDDDTVLIIVIKMIQDEVSKYFNFMYEDFIRAISPVNGATDVSIDTSIEISVGVNLFQYILYIPSLLDDSATRDDSRQLIAKPSGNMLQYYNGNLEEASKHGFRQWLEDSDCPDLPKVLLLEAADNIHNSSSHTLLPQEDVTYNIYGVNDGYEGGDKHSWQRYTAELPVECRLSSDFIHNLHFLNQQQPIVSNPSSLSSSSLLNSLLLWTDAYLVTS
mmetsp:Transcript_2224/g.3457  ORF Transcript_2224/g.3457 Transcript_2224/m.3457 type:complete len:294 (-) Transcript_2224:419-1300(-)